jgi:transposase
MEGIVPRLDRRAKWRLRKWIRRTKDADLERRCLIVLNLADDRRPVDVARALCVSRSTVYRVAARYCAEGEAGLVDRREGNGDRKVDDDYLGALREAVGSSPADYGWRRPTWTQELLIETLRRLTGISISRSAMSRALRVLGARLGRPKPIVDCPWAKAAKTRRLREIARLVETAPENEVVVYEDEVDVHLNPKIGPDWMLPGQQKTVRTPGRNEKRYLAGAENARTGELTWVQGDRKSTGLFVLLLWELVQRYPDAPMIHVVLDNYCIHSTRQVELSLDSEQGRRLRLHFLPPYCPDHNRIERTWRDLHANVTRNHDCADMDELMRNVRHYLGRRNTEAATAA